MTDDMLSAGRQLLQLQAVEVQVATDTDNGVSTATSQVFDALNWTQTGCHRRGVQPASWPGRTGQRGHEGGPVGARRQQAERHKVGRQLAELAVDHVQRRADQAAARGARSALGVPAMRLDKHS